MTVLDKARTTAQELASKIKNVAGRAAGDRRPATEGRTDEAGGPPEQAGEQVNDAFRR